MPPAAAEGPKSHVRGGSAEGPEAYAELDLQLMGVEREVGEVVAGGLVERGEVLARPPGVQSARTTTRENGGPRASLSAAFGLSARHNPSSCRR